MTRSNGRSTTTYNCVPSLTATCKVCTTRAWQLTSEVATQVVGAAATIGSLALSYSGDAMDLVLSYTHDKVKSGRPTFVTRGATLTTVETNSRRTLGSSGALRLGCNDAARTYCTAGVRNT
nr:hypothetical protein CFP56_19215 [Quercus suber]